MENDSLTGWVKDRSAGPFVELYSRIRFKTESRRIRKKYSPQEIMGYGYSGSVYDSVPLLEESSFLKFDSTVN